MTMAFFIRCAMVAMWFMLVGEVVWNSMSRHVDTEPQASGFRVMRVFTRHIFILVLSTVAMGRVLFEAR